MPPTIYIARHGETAWNVEVRVQGQEDIPLTPSGYRNRRALFYLLKDQSIRHIYTSALSRTILTAVPLARHFTLEIESTPNLNEMAFGLLEGETLLECDDWTASTWNWWLEDPLTRRIPGGGECYTDLLQRIDAFLALLASLDNQGDILVVAHFRANQMLTGRLLGLTPEEALAILQPNNLVYRIRQEPHLPPAIDHALAFTDQDPVWEPGLLISPDARGPIAHPAASLNPHP
jgi:broad specificity phosphatase PhoE